MNWLPLTDYSTKYRVSVSTLRRRIKAEDIRFKFDDGKYLILDEPPSLTQPRVYRPSLMSEPTRGESQVSTLNPSEIVARLHQATASDEPVLVAANRLLNELKKAYTLILQEKEEQILQLREEVSDLRTLVRVLESEVTRLRGS